MIEDIASAVAELSVKAAETPSPSDAIRYTEAIVKLMDAYTSAAAVEVAFAEAGIEWGTSECSDCECDE